MAKVGLIIVGLIGAYSLAILAEYMAVLYYLKDPLVNGIGFGVFFVTFISFYLAYIKD